jgi:hypothetical protein
MENLMTTTARRQQLGPPLPIPTIAYTVLTLAAVAVNAKTPRPAASGAEVLQYTQDHGTLIKIGAFLLFASSVPLAIAAAVFSQRLRTLGITAPGATIALIGGTLASSGLALSGIFAWATGRLPADAESALPRALADLSFLTGGPAYAVMFAVLIAGISVPGLLADLLPRPMAWIGLALAVIGAISTLTLLDIGFGFLLPIVRFGGTLWLVIAAFLLPRTRHARNQ